MRIRKRAVPLPLSLLSPVPFSDPHLRLVQLPTHPRSDSQPSDHPPPHDLAAAVIPQPPRPMELKGYEDEKNKDQRQGDNHTSKQRISGAVADNGVLPPPPPIPSNQTEVVATEGRWCYGDKAIPLKKRKVSFEMNSAVVTKEAKMKSKTNKKCPLQNSSGEEEEKDEEEKTSKAREVDNSSALNANDNNKKSKTKSRKINITTGGAKNSIKSRSKKGGSIMEGSRCSRVNGRGWRCLQPTLVGYSLCEHHLGKGRLRSMSSVRVRPQKPSRTLTSSSPSLPSEEKSCSIELGGGESAGNAIQEDNICDQDHSKLLSKAAGSGIKKRTKLGIVKARSLSSLLCQPDTAVVQMGASSAIKQHEM